MVETWQEEEPVDRLREPWRAPFPGGRKHLGLVPCGQSKAGISAPAELRENQPLSRKVMFNPKPGWKEAGEAPALPASTLLPEVSLLESAGAISPVEVV